MHEVGGYEKVSISMRRDQTAAVRAVAIEEKHGNISRVVQDLIDEALEARRLKRATETPELAEAVA